jgi:cell division initiation protein
MSLTPVEIRHVKLGRRLGGYDRPATDALLVRIAESFEDVWRERADLRDEIERLEGELVRFRELEVLLRNTLVSAERSADELRAQAHREADVILDEARVRAREIGGGAESERERVRADIRRLKNVEAQMRAEYRAFLATALDRLKGDTEERETPGQAA